MYTDILLEAVGGRSRFQVLMLLMVRCDILGAWSLLMMSFTGAAPEWWCVPDVNATTINNITSGLCPSNNANNSCTFVYSMEKNTIINQWDLVCDNKWVPASVISIQMFGLLLGALTVGQAADMFGRKPTLYASLLTNAITQVITAFSVSYQMFATLRFLIGVLCGWISVTQFTLSVEFMNQKCRSFCSAIPFWTLGVCSFAFSCWLRPDWSHQHIILAVLHVPFLLGWFIVPESFRWLATKGRIDEAEKVVDQMCRYNKREKPANTRTLLEKVAEEEQERASGRKYTYIDLYRRWSLCWKSLCLQFTMMCLSLVYYGISFGVQNLFGNLYLNMFILSIMDLPVVCLTYFMNNRIGRRWAAFILLATSAIGAFSVVIATRTTKSILINVLVVVTKCFGGAVWITLELFICETYPTVIRTIGCGAAMAATRTGGILSPFIFFMGGTDLLPPFLIVGSIQTVCAIIALVMRETKGKPMQDSLKNTKRVALDGMELDDVNHLDEDGDARINGMELDDMGYLDEDVNLRIKEMELDDIGHLDEDGDVRIKEIELDNMGHLDGDGDVGIKEIELDDMGHLDEDGDVRIKEIELDDMGHLDKDGDVRIKEIELDDMGHLDEDSDTRIKGV